MYLFIYLSINLLIEMGGWRDSIEISVCHRSNTFCVRKSCYRRTWTRSSSRCLNVNKVKNSFLYECGMFWRGESPFEVVASSPSCVTRSRAPRAEPQLAAALKAKGEAPPPRAEFATRTHLSEAHGGLGAEAQRKQSRAMWLVSVLVPLLKLYLCGIRVLIYQMFNRSFTLPGLLSLPLMFVSFFFLKNKKIEKRKKIETP